MRTLPGAITSHLSGSGGLLVHTLLWLSGRDRGDNSLQTLGLWTGADAAVVSVGGAPRTYYGAGTLIGPEPVDAEMGAVEQTCNITVSGIAPPVVQALRAYNPRLAPVEVHSWWLDPATHIPLAAPVMEFRGTIMDVSLPTPEEGGSAIASIECVSDAWRLTRGLTLKKSHTALTKRQPGDTFRQYNDVTGIVTAWGEMLKEHDGPSGAGGGGQAARGSGSSAPARFGSGAPPPSPAPRTGPRGRMR